jgi:hypothetical protein
MNKTFPKNGEDGENSIQYTSGGFANKFGNNSLNYVKNKDPRSSKRYQESSREKELDSYLSAEDNLNS